MTEAGGTTKASRLLVRADTAVRPYPEFGFVTNIKFMEPEGMFGNRYQNGNTPPVIHSTLH